VIAVISTFGALVAMLVFVVEFLRWTFRPEARRLRTIKKLGGRR
jgi:hypothetical protein